MSHSKRNFMTLKYLFKISRKNISNCRKTKLGDFFKEEKYIMSFIAIILRI